MTDFSNSVPMEKLNADIGKYRILGACNPIFSHLALQLENKIGTMSPCNVIIQELPGDGIEVPAVDPVASMQAVGNAELLSVAGIVQGKMKDDIDALS